MCVQSSVTTSATPIYRDFESVLSYNGGVKQVKKENTYYSNLVPTPANTSERTRPQLRMEPYGVRHNQCRTAHTSLLWDFLANDPISHRGSKPVKGQWLFLSRRDKHPQK